MDNMKWWTGDDGNLYIADEKDPAYVEWEKGAAEREAREAAKHKDTLARFVSSIEGISDEDLHAMFVARAVKKAVWNEQDLQAGIKHADREMGWTDPVTLDFDELLQEAGSKDA